MSNVFMYFGETKKINKKSRILCFLGMGAPARSNPLNPSEPHIYFACKPPSTPKSSLARTIFMPLNSFNRNRCSSPETMYLAFPSKAHSSNLSSPGSSRITLSLLLGWMILEMVKMYLTLSSTVFSSNPNLSYIRTFFSSSRSATEVSSFILPSSTRPMIFDSFPSQWISDAKPLLEKNNHKLFIQSLKK